MNLNVNNINLFYEKNGNGKPIILLHGNGETHHIFDRMSKVLQTKFTVYAIDTRGHGQSSSVDEYHYDDMMEDIVCLLHELKIKEPILYGFSDGGIVGLLIAIKYPNLLSKLIISGANTFPKGLKRSGYTLMKVNHFFTKDKKLKLMLDEPNITNEMLNKICIPVFVTAGSKDVIDMKHTLNIEKQIPNAKLEIFENETHDSYVTKNDKLCNYLVELLKVD